MATNPLPRTPASAPPNFYSQVGQMGTNQIQQGATGQQAAQQQNPDQSQSPSTGPDPDREFLEASTKLLTVLDKLGEMKPRGLDVTKYTKAMAQVMKDCMKQVFTGGKKGQLPGSTSSAEDAGTNPADQTTGAGAGPLNTAGVASASNATGTA